MSASTPPGRSVVSPRGRASPSSVAALAAEGLAAREELGRMAAEREAVRRVAGLVADGAPAEVVFHALATQLGSLVGATATGVLRFGADGTATVVGAWGGLAELVPVGAALVLGDVGVVSEVARSGLPARADERSPGAPAERLQHLDLRPAVAGPVIVGGRPWGVMLAARRPGPMPPGAEDQLAGFAELVASVIFNVEMGADLAASRARLVTTADEERRRVVRDLHDGAQQRLVHTIIVLKLARAELAGAGGPAADLVGEALEHAEQATAELRELAHGILPAVLAQGGLAAAAGELAARSSVPVAVDVPGGRLRPAVEATAYFVMAEALTNVGKHAGATRAELVARSAGGLLQVEVRDDGAGGAQPGGSGLLGLADRVAAVDGRLRIQARPGGGTVVAADIPLGAP